MKYIRRKQKIETVCDLPTANDLPFPDERHKTSFGF